MSALHRGNPDVGAGLAPAREGTSPSPTLPAGRRGEAGYNLVVLIVAVTILNILLAVSLPLWSTAIRREKEEELIFRGLQYAEAIRVYQIRHQGAFPTRLAELIETKPRCIRQLWKDPMTEDGQWGLIFLGQENQQRIRVPPPGGQRGNQPGDQPGGDPQGQDGDDDPDGSPSSFGPRPGEEVAVGPIVGVYSKSGKESILTFFGKQRYDEWRFTVQMLLQPQVPPPGGDVAKHAGGFTGGGIVVSTRWLGRPLPYFDQFSQFPGGNPGALDGTLPGTSGQRGPQRPGRPGSSNRNPQNQP
jgi:type II secretory pathway pseudopilin PulG